VAENVARVARRRLALRDLLLRSQAELADRRRLLSVRDHVREEEARARGEERRRIEAREVADQLRRARAARAGEERAHAESARRRRADLARDKERLRLAQRDNARAATYARRAAAGANEARRGLEHAQLDALQRGLARLALTDQLEARAHQELAAHAAARYRALQAATKGWEAASEADGARLDKRLGLLQQQTQRALRAFDEAREVHRFECAERARREVIVLERRWEKEHRDPAVRARDERCAATIQVRARRWMALRARAKAETEAAEREKAEEEERIERERDALEMARMKAIEERANAEPEAPRAPVAAAPWAATGGGTTAATAAADAPAAADGGAAAAEAVPEAEADASEAAVAPGGEVVTAA